MPSKNRLPQDSEPRFTPAERAQIRQLFQYLVAIIIFVILASLVVGSLLNLSN